MINCREEKLCAFCKYWLGSSPDVDYITGNSKVRRTAGLCSQDESGRTHNSTDLCPKFSRGLSYM